MQLPVILSLRPSRRLALILLAAHAGTFVALADIAAGNLVLWVKLVLQAVIVLSLWLHLTKLYGRQRIVSLCLHGDGLLEYIRKSGESATVEIHPHTTASPLLTVLLLGRGKRLEALTLAPDALDCEDFRKLRLWLRWLALNDKS